MVIKELLYSTKENSARTILAYVLGKSKEYLLIHENEELSKEDEIRFLELLEKRKSGYPLQYIIGTTEFMKLNFIVNENVLIPRQDTEILVEEVISISNEMLKNKENIKILDLCTGSGCIAISLAKYIENANITAVDISKEAIDVAKLNAKNNNVEDKIEFNTLDVLKEKIADKFDIIVSNPPYIKTNILKKLQQEIKYEPQIALDATDTGLMFYEKITENFSKNICIGGYLCFEIGYDQRYDVSKILKDNKYTDIYCKQDLAANDRVVIGRKA